MESVIKNTDSNRGRRPKRWYSSVFGGFESLQGDSVTKTKEIPTKHPASGRMSEKPDVDEIRGHSRDFGGWRPQISPTPPMSGTHGGGGPRGRWPAAPEKPIPTQTRIAAQARRSACRRKLNDSGIRAHGSFPVRIHTCPARSPILKFMPRIRRNSRTSTAVCSAGRSMQAPGADYWRIQPGSKQ